MPTFPVRLPAALTVALCVACGGSSDPTSPQTQVVGTYALRTADGKAVPATVEQDATGKIEVLGGSATIDAHGTCSTRSRTAARARTAAW